MSTIKMWVNYSTAWRADIEKYLQYNQIDDTNYEFLTRLWFVFVFVTIVLIAHTTLTRIVVMLLFIIDLLWIGMK